jgi:hypothetical protein
MKKLLFILILSLPLQAEGQLLWQKTFRPVNPTGQSEYGKSFVIYSNGEIITSTQYYFGLWVMKFDTAGNVLWSKSIPGSGSRKLIKADADKLIFVDNFYIGIIITKTDTSANVIWSKTFNFDVRHQIYDIIKTDNDDFILVGGTYYYDSDSLYSYAHTRPIAFCIDSSGNLKWAKSYYPYVMQITPYDMNAAVLCGIDKVNSNEYIISGVIADTLKDENGILLMKIDTLGNVNDSKFLTSPRNDGNDGVLKTLDGNFLVYGVTLDTIPSPGPVVIHFRPVYFLLDSTLNYLHKSIKIMVNSGGVRVALQYPDSTFLLLFGAGGFIRLDKNASLISFSSIMSAFQNYKYQVKEFDGSIYIIGMEWQGSEDFYFAKALNTPDGGCNTYYFNHPFISDSTFQLSPFTLYDIPLTPTIQSLNLSSQPFAFTEHILCSTAVNVNEYSDTLGMMTVYPNPVKKGETIKIKLPAITAGKIIISLKNALGQEVYHTTSFSHEIDISTDAENLGSGIYFISVFSPFGYIGTSKIIIY